MGAAVRRQPPPAGAAALTDTIVIFGCGVRPDGSPSPTLRRRVEAALAHARRLSDPYFMPTGGLGRNPPAEAEVMARLLREAGVPAARILPEPTARDTLASVHACAALMRSRADGVIWVATSDYHLPRCVVLLRLAGLSARACPPPGSAHGWWQAAYWWGREAVALPVDVALLLWAKRRRAAQSAA